MRAQQMSSVYAFQVVRVTLPSCQTWSSIVSLYASSCSLSNGIARDSVWWSNCHR